MKDIVKIIDGDNLHNRMMCSDQLLHYYSKPWYIRIFAKYPYWCENYDGYKAPTKTDKQTEV